MRGINWTIIVINGHPFIHFNNLYSYDFYIWPEKIVSIILVGALEIEQPTLGLGDMAQKIITIIFISVDIDNYHDKCQIFISFKFKARFLLQSESFRNQTINLP